MSRVLFLVSPFLALMVSCAQRDNTNVSSASKGEIGSYTGSLATPRGQCSVSYLGTEKDVANSLFSSSTADSHYVMTSGHCLQGVDLSGAESALQGFSIAWQNGSRSKVETLVAMGSMAQGKIDDDVAVLTIDSPSALQAVANGLRPFLPSRASERGSEGSRIREPKTGDILLVRAFRGGKKESYSCYLLDPLPQTAGFSMQCAVLSADVASGLSGALVTSMRGEPVGVFKATLPGTTNKFSVHALAWGSLKDGFYGSGAARGSFASAENTLSTLADCKASLMRDCAQKSPATQQDVDAFWNKELPLLSNVPSTCTYRWTGKAADDSRMTNGEACGFVDVSREGFRRQLEAVLGRNDDGECIEAPGKACTANSRSCYIAGKTPKTSCVFDAGGGFTDHRPNPDDL